MCRCVPVVAISLLGLLAACSNTNESPDGQLVEVELPRDAEVAPDIRDGSTDALRQPDASLSPDATIDPPALRAGPVIGYTFGTLENWARPIDDVLMAGEMMFGDNFSRGINALVSDGERLWIGYGDANVNLGGVIPITFRSFVSADNPVPVVGATSGEEQLDQFRFVDGELWMPGVDSLGTDEEFHFPNVGGNMYTYGDAGWVKHRTVHGGEHVHDVAWWQGAAWAVGSGANNRPEFETGRIHRYLWRSQDRGRSWMTIHRDPFPIPGSGDTRYTLLLPQSDALYVFGYEFNWEENEIRVANAQFDGWTLNPLEDTDDLQGVFASGTLPITDNSSLLWGIDVQTSPLRNRAWLVSNGRQETLGFLDGRTVISATLIPESGEALVLSRLGDAYRESPERFDLTIHRISVDEPHAAHELLSWTASEAPQSVAFFDGSLFVGQNDGRVRRAVGDPESNVE